VRVLHLEPKRYDDVARATVEGAEGVEAVDYVDLADAAELPGVLAREAYGAVFVRIGLDVDRAAMDAAPGLRYVVTPTTGLDHIDLDLAAERGITVVSLRGHVHLLDTVAATAELTWALLLALVRRLPVATGSVLAGSWQRDDLVGTELRGRTLGIVGYGRLGRMVAGYGAAFGMDVLVHDHDDAQLARAPEGVRPTALDDLLATADVVSLHLPLDPTTVGFLDAARLAVLKRGALLVNTARGELVDEAALVAGLESGRIGGLAADVVADDAVWPGVVPAGQPVVELARRRPDLVVVTPHIGGYGRDAIATTRRFVAQQFADRVADTGSIPHPPTDTDPIEGTPP
jgi:D-3-phosphoglycerate dehydrogenase